MDTFLALHRTLKANSKRPTALYSSAYSFPKHVATPLVESAAEKQNRSNPGTLFCLPMLRPVYSLSKDHLVPLTGPVL